MKYICVQLSVREKFLFTNQKPNQLKKIISKTIFTLIALILFINSSFCQIHNPITGWLHTNGTLILDANNNVICLNGINSSGMEWGAGNEWTGVWHQEHCADSTYGCYATPYQQTYPQEFDSIKSWGFNFVRLLISWANLEPTIPIDSNGIVVHHWNQTYLDSLDIIVSKFGSRGIALILSMHQWAWSPFF